MDEQRVQGLRDAASVFDLVKEREDDLPVVVAAAHILLLLVVGVGGHSLHQAKPVNHILIIHDATHTLADEPTLRYSVTSIHLLLSVPMSCPIVSLHWLSISFIFISYYNSLVLYNHITYFKSLERLTS